MKYTVLLSAILVLAIMGCSGSSADLPTSPSMTPDRTVETSSSHYLWGMWEFQADPQAGTLEIIPLRSSAFHANVLPFLEPPAGLKLSIANLVFDGDIADVDVRLTHPFPGYSEYTGFDVCGILISNGMWEGFGNPDIVMAGPGDTRLLNADGYTRWWNPSEFAVDGQPILRYRDGLMGTKNDVANYNCTVNGYKLFCDDLDADDDFKILGPDDRVTFTHGYMNERHYTIDFTGGMAFNYAVDASWEPPTGDEPYTEEDFPMDANRTEAWAISVTELENTLWSAGSESGGNLSLMIDVWDHMNADQNGVWADSPGHFTPAYTNAAIGGGDHYSTYQIEIVDATPPAGEMDILIEVESEVLGFWDLLPDVPQTGYFIYTADVAGETLFLTSPNGGEEWYVGEEHEITWNSQSGITEVDLLYSKDDFVSDINTIVTNWPDSGSYLWEIPDDPSETVKVRVVESGGGLSDDSDDYFTILPDICDFGTTGHELDTDHHVISGCWSHTGILATWQDSTQRIIGHSWPGEGAGGVIKVFNASDPMAGAVASYDTGDLIYCNNDQAMWIDKMSETGIDRIIYNNFGSGSPTSGYQLKTIDWNGTGFENPQTLPKSGSIWSLCVTPDGDIILHNAYSVAPSFYFYDKSNNYSYSFMFQLQQTTCDFGSVGSIREMIYNPELDAVVIFCNNQNLNNDGQVFVLSMTGTLLYEDTSVFDIADGHKLAFRVGIDIDMSEPGCRIVVYGGEDDLDNNTLSWCFARYSADFEEKATYEITSPPYYGPCRGDIAADGTLWASPHTGTAHFYEFTQPPDW